MVNEDLSCSEVNRTWGKEIDYSIARQETDDTFRTISIVLAVIHNSYVVLSTARIIYYKNRYEWLQKRLVQMGYITTIGVFLNTISSTGLWRQVFLIPCWIGYLAAMSIVPFVGYPFFVRTLDHYNRFVFAEALRDFGRQNNDDNNAVSSTGSNGDESGSIAGAILSHMLCCTYRTNKPSINDEAELYKQLRVLKVMKSPTFYAGMLFLFSTPFIVNVLYRFTDNYMNPASNCVGCYHPADDAYVAYIFGSISIMGCCYIAWINRKKSDPFGLLTEVRLCMMYGGTIALGSYFLYQNFLPDSMFQYFTLAWIEGYGLLLLQFFQTDYQIMLARRYEAKSKTLKDAAIIIRGGRGGETSSSHASVALAEQDVGNNNNSNNNNRLSSQQKLPQSLKNFQAFLEIDSAEMNNFEDFLVTEYGVENLLCYKECRNFEKFRGDWTEATARARAVRIFQRYIKFGSVMEVNISHEEREAVIRVMQQQPIKPDREIFQDVQHELLTILYGSYARFILSGRTLATNSSHVSTQVQVAVLPQQPG